MNLDSYTDLLSVSQTLKLSQSSICKCIASLWLAQFMQDRISANLILRGGLAAQLHLGKHSNQRLSSDVDFYFTATSVSEFDYLWDRVCHTLMDCGFVQDVSLRSKEGFQISIPMISFDVVFGNQEHRVFSQAGDIKADITFVPFSLSWVALEASILGLNIGKLVQTIPIEFIVAEKLLKFAGEGVTFPSRQFARLAKQIYDLSGLLGLENWANDYEKVKDYLELMLPRETVYRQREISCEDLFLMIRSGVVKWHEYLRGGEGQRAVQDFEFEYVPTVYHARYSQWLERSKQIQEFAEAVISQGVA